jgi:Uma2 family endonuclease
MSTASLPPPAVGPVGFSDSPVPPAAPRVRLFTVADLAALPDMLPSGSVSWELVDGVPILMSPPGYRHGRAAARFVIELHAQGEVPGLGEVGDEVGVILRRNPDRVAGPDAVFLLAASLPARLSPEGYLETIPEIVVEVRSKNDSGPAVAAKAGEYLAAGVKAVWVADPDDRTVAVHTAGVTPVVFGPTDTLTSPLLPGFSVPVDRLFPVPSVTA